MTDQLPAVLPSGALTPAASADTYIVPALVAALGDQASWRYVEFFAANIRNPNTRRAYARARSREDAGARRRRVAEAHRQHSDNDALAVYARGFRSDVGFADGQCHVTSRFWP